MHHHVPKCYTKMENRMIINEKEDNKWTIQLFEKHTEWKEPYYAHYIGQANDRTEDKVDQNNTKIHERGQTRKT